MKKHAYLIMAHTQPELLKKLVELLDDEKNDIYIHIDKKADNYPIDQVISAVKRSKCRITERIDVRWGSYSQINCEMILLKAAVKGHYQYYHLLSGMDLPIRSQEEIHGFFEKYDGLEFVDEDQQTISADALSRVRYRHHFYGKQGSFSDLLGALEVKLQKLLGIDRTKKYREITFQKGRNWFSITHGLAELIVEKEEWIREVFKDSVCGDELFVQTVAGNSKFAKNICNPITMPEIPDTRYIDWERGENNSPYVFRMEDMEKLKKSEGLFARKFDLNVDAGIVEALYELRKKES